MTEPQHLIETDLVIDATGKFHLQESATWAKFLGIIGFVYSLLVLLGAFVMAAFVAGGKGSVPDSAEGKMGGTSVIFIYLVLAGILFLMSLHLFRFAKKLHYSLQSNDPFKFTAALKNLRIYFRFAGIISAVVLLFTILGVIGMLVTAGVAK